MNNDDLGIGAKFILGGIFVILVIANAKELFEIISNALNLGVSIIILMVAGAIVIIAGISLLILLLGFFCGLFESLFEEIKDWIEEKRLRRTIREIRESPRPQYRPRINPIAEQSFDEPDDIPSVEEARQIYLRNRRLR